MRKYLLSWYLWLRRQPVLLIPASFVVLACLIIWLIWIPRQQRVIDDLAAVLAVADEKVTFAVSEKTSVVQTNLTHFQQTLGEPRYTESYLRSIFAAAQKQGLSLLQAEYVMGQESAAIFAAYQVRLPIRGNYAAVRSFVSQVLLALPFAALDSIRFERESVSSPTMTATIRLTMYLQPVALQAGGSTQP